MPQIGGKPVKKSSKTKSSKTKSSSTSKRHFTVVIGSKEHGLYCSSSPSSAARKAVSKLCGKEKGKKVEFCLREITQGSKKKTYGPYLGHVEKLAKPIQLKGRLVERMPVARLKAKSSAKKGGMRGGDFINDIIEGKRLENSNDKLDNDLLLLLRERGNRNKLNSNTKLFETYKFLDIPKEDLKRLIFQVSMQIDMAGASPINYELNVNNSNNLKKYSDNYRELMMLLKKKFMKNHNND
jgi:hypothetical protein